jgi:hypothetical protein
MPCERSGCEAYRRPSPASVGQGVAGVVAALSDVVGNGCQECPLGRATLRLWRAERPIANAEALPEVVAATPTSVIDADGRYQAALGPADYLLCASHPGAPADLPCAVVSVTAGKVVTVNVKVRDGLTSLLVFDASMSVPRPETFDFSEK